MAAIRHIIFELFGPLVTRPHYFVGLRQHQSSWQLLCDHGLRLNYSCFMEMFTETQQQLERQSQYNLQEYSMEQLVDEFCKRHLPDSSATLRSTFVHHYLTEWSQSIQHPLEISAMLHRLHRHYSLSVLSNSQHRPLVEQHLDKLGVSDLMTDVMTSVDCGQRKPHSTIFATALKRLGLNAGDCLFIGDDYRSDYMGATDAGMISWLIDPDGKHPVPETDRLKCALGIETRLLRQRMAAA